MHSVVGPWRLSKARVVVLIVFFATVLLVYSRFSASTLSANRATSERTIPLVITLASTKDRIAYELPLTLASLLRQETQPDAIHLYLPQEDEVEIRAMMHDHVMPKLARDSRVALIEVFYVPDVGPAAKFVHTIDLFKRKQTDAILAVCDDDHLYPGDWLTTLYAYHMLHPTHATALRGWRVNKDGSYGFNHEMFANNIIHGWHILEAFQVCVITANAGYMLRAQWFSQVDLKNYSTAPKGARYVDDIWMSGNLARLSIPRFVVPARNFQLHIAKSNTLDSHMKQKGVRRYQANTETLKYFLSEFLRENLPLYFENGEGGGEKAEFASHFWRTLYIPYTEQVLRVGLTNGCPTYVCAFFSFVSLFYK